MTAESGPFLSDRAVFLLRMLLLAVLSTCVLYYVAFSMHWPILRDTSIMHYVNFLVDHGMRPYQDITDNNLPGAYLADRVGSFLFGTGDLSWRAYDLSLLAIITASMVVIALPYDWMAGIFGGLLFALLHGSEGPDFPVEREEILTALLVLGFALLFLAIRRLQPSLMLLFGFCTGAASMIKPTIAPFGVVLLVAALAVLRKRKVPTLRYLLWGLLGMVLTGLVVLAYLWRHQAFGPLLFVVRSIMPSYVSLSNKSVASLLVSMMPRNLIPVTLIVAVLAASGRRWTWERWFVFSGVVFGAISYVGQRKGSIYHRYPFVAFLLLLLGLELLTAMQGRGWRRLAGAAGIVLTLLLSVPHYISELRRSPATSTMPFALALTDDLRALAAQGDLQRKVECLDLTYGCFTALQHLGLVENNGYTGDLLLFSPVPSRAVDYYRDRFWKLTVQSPPEVFVLSNEWYPYSVSFGKVNTWPAFASYLGANYELRLARSFPQPGMPATVPAGTESPAPGYRIYVRRGSGPV